MHILRELRGKRAWRMLPELRWQLFSAANPPGSSARQASRIDQTRPQSRGMCAESRLTSGRK
jgi:hypothetical protein